MGRYKPIGQSNYTFHGQYIALCQNGLFIIRQAHSISVVNNKGKIIVPFGKYSQYATPPPVMYEGDDVGSIRSRWYPSRFEASVLFKQYIGVKQNEKWAVINAEGQEIIPPKYDWIGIFNKDVAPVMINKKYGITDIAGNEVVPAVYDNTWLTNNDLVIVTNNKRSGVVSITNKLLIPIKYNGISQINNNAFLVDTDNNVHELKYGIVDAQNHTVIPVINYGIKKFGSGYLVERDNIGKSVFDAKGIQQTGYIDGSYEINYPVWHSGTGAVVYNERTDKFKSYQDVTDLMYKQDDKWGLLDSAGTELTSPLYDQCWHSRIKNVIIVNRDNKWGTINYRGKQLLPIQYDEITQLTENILLLKKDGKYGLANSNSKIISQLKYDRIIFIGGEDNSPSTHQNISVMVNKKWGYVNDNGKEITPLKYDEVEPMRHDVYWVTCDGKRGLVNSVGVEIAPCIYNGLVLTGLRSVIVIKNKLYGLIDRYTGAIVLPPIYKNVYLNPLGGTPFYWVTNQDKKIGMVGNSGKWLLPFLYDIVYQQDGVSIKRLIVGNNGNYGVIELSGQVIIPLIYQSVEYIRWVQGPSKNYYLVVRSGKTGIVDDTGKPLIPLVYHYLNYLRPNYILASKDGHVGVIDLANNMVIPFIYDELYQIVPDRYSFKIDHKCGLLNLEGKEIVAPLYESLYNFLDHVFIVTKDHKHGIIDDMGKVIAEPIYDNCTSCGKQTILIEKDHLMGLIDRSGKVIYPCKYTSIKCVDDKVIEVD